MSIERFLEDEAAEVELAREGAAQAEYFRRALAATWRIFDAPDIIETSFHHSKRQVYERTRWLPYGEAELRLSRFRSEQPLPSWFGRVVLQRQGPTGQPTVEYVAIDVRSGPYEHPYARLDSDAPYINFWGRHKNQSGFGYPKYPEGYDEAKDKELVDFLESTGKTIAARSLDIPNRPVRFN